MMEELQRKTVAEFRASQKRPITVVLDNVRSMHNVGSVFRSADAFLVEAIVLCGFTPQPPHRDIHKTALGATETVPWQYAADVIQVLSKLRNDGYRIIAVEQAEGSIPLQQFSWQMEEKIAVIFGNEVEGVQDSVIAICDECVEIPQSGTKHSLNISVAAGIVLYQLSGW